MEWGQCHLPALMNSFSGLRRSSQFHDSNLSPEDHVSSVLDFACVQCLFICSLHWNLYFGLSVLPFWHTIYVKWQNQIDLLVKPVFFWSEGASRRSLFIYLFIASALLKCWLFPYLSLVKKMIDVCWFVWTLGLTTDNYLKKNKKNPYMFLREDCTAWSLS